MTAPPANPHDAEEAEFTRLVLAEPGDATVRLVFADWLDEHGQPVRAKYLREVRPLKFLRLIAVRGAWALFPSWDTDRMPPPVPAALRMNYTTSPPPRPSPRCEAWVRRINRGWWVPAHVSRNGWSMMVCYFGVYAYEYLHILLPMISSNSTPAELQRA